MERVLEWGMESFVETEFDIVSLWCAIWDCEADFLTLGAEGSVA